MQLFSIDWAAYRPEGMTPPLNLIPETIYSGGQAVGRRIFPEKISYDDQYSVDRRTIWVEALITPAVEGVPVYFRIWDIDDPSSNSIIDPNGSAGGDNWGGCTLEEVVYTNSEGYARACLTVSMRPGDNYRASASLFSDKLEAMNPAEAIDPALFDDFYIKTTPQYLVVWRKIHVEHDVMGEPDRVPAPMEYFGTLNGTVRLAEQVGYYTYVADIGVDWRPTHSDWLPNDQLAGALFTDTNRPTVTNKPVIFNGTAYLALEPGLTDMVYGDPYQINTDDVDPGSSTVLPSINVLAYAFSRAYVRVVLNELPPEWSNEQIPFRRNLLLDQSRLPETRDNVTKYIRQFRDSPVNYLYWCTYVVAAYEGDITQDNDPNGEIHVLGNTVRNVLREKPSFAAIYQESIREYSAQVWPETLAHEVGHSFGLTPSTDDEDAGYIMYEYADITSPATIFSPESVVEIRSEMEPW